MMRTHLAALLLPLALVGGPAAVVSTAAPATAADSCVSQREFASVKKGFSKAKVARVFGTKGSREAISRGYGVTIEIRSYRACTRFGAVSVSFENGRLSAKSAVF